MIKFRASQKLFAFIVLLCSWGVDLPAIQDAATGSDIDQINSLLSGLSDHSRTPEQVLDPALNPADRARDIKRLSAPKYELKLIPTDGIHLTTNESAKVPIRVRYNSGDGNELDTTATAQFVKRNGTWYFSNFDFMSWPLFLIAVLIVGVLVAITYATIVLVLRNRLVRKGLLRTNIVKIFFPIFWPDLFRQTA
jgi:hypothetical protein